MGGQSEKHLNIHPYQSEPLVDNEAGDGAVYLFQVFPCEVWSFILEFVDYATYQNLCGASSLFQKLLSPHRIHILFDPVLEILMDYRHKWLWKPENYIESDYYHLRPLLSLRLVCRSWRNRVNRYLENLPRWDETKQGYAMADSDNINKEMDVFFTTTFQKVHDFTRFEKKFKSTHNSSHNDNPLPARRITLHFDDWFGSGVIWVHSHVPDVRFYTAFSKWLRHYGQHIWYLNITGDRQNSVEFYWHLKDMLELLPNLKSFRFSVQDKNPLPDDDNFPDLVPSYKDIEISKHIAFLHFEGIPLVLGKQLLDKPSDQLPNLTRLEITLETEQEIWQFFDQRLANRAPIQNLRILFPKSLDQSSSLGPIFAAMAIRFGDTLNSLEIRLPKNVPFLLEGRLKLPKLKHLQVEVIEEGAAVALDFLLGMADHLEELEFIVNWNPNQDVKQFQRDEREVQFYKHLDKLHHSNLWTKFSKLRWVKFRRGGFGIPVLHCTRKEWKAKNGEKVNHV